MLMYVSKMSKIDQNTPKGCNAMYDQRCQRCWRLDQIHLRAVMLCMSEMSKMSKIDQIHLRAVMLCMSKMSKIDQIHLRACKPLCMSKMSKMSKMGKEHTHTLSSTSYDMLLHDIGLMMVWSWKALSLSFPKLFSDWKSSVKYYRKLWAKVCVYVFFPSSTSSTYIALHPLCVLYLLRHLRHCFDLLYSIQCIQCYVSQHLQHQTMCIDTYLARGLYDGTHNRS